MKSARYGLAVEGWIIVLVLALLAALLFGSAWPGSALVPLLLLGLALLRYRDPERAVPSDPLGVLSPVDGTVVDIDNGPEGLRIVIRIAAFGAYVLRAPTEGNVVDPGSLSAGHGLAIRTDEGEEVLVRLLGPGWLPPAATVDYDQRLGQGQRCGLRRGARAAEIWLPAGSHSAVQRGDTTFAGESVLGHFHREGARSGRA